MVSREIRRSIVKCCALVLLVGAADLALFFWLDGPARLALNDGIERYWGIVLLTGAFCFPISAGILAWSLVNLRRAQASNGWPVTNGEVLASDIETTRARGSTLFWPRVRYKYVVLDTPYENDVIEFGLGGFKKEDKAKEFIACYPAGKKVEVHFDPVDPQESCLQTADAAAWSSARWSLPPAVAPFIFGALVIFP